MNEFRKPEFAQAWPSHEELDKLVRAFAQGNYYEVRKGAPELERAALERGDEAVAAGARELFRRVQPDPLGKKLFLVAFLLLLGVVLAAYGGNLRP